MSGYNTFYLRDLLVGVKTIFVNAKGKTGDGNPKDLLVNEQGKLQTETVVVQDIFTSYGKTIDDRPPASSVPIGHVFMAVKTQEMWQSYGDDWEVF